MSPAERRAREIESLRYREFHDAIRLCQPGKVTKLLQNAADSKSVANRLIMDEPHAGFSALTMALDLGFEKIAQVLIHFGATMTFGDTAPCLEQHFRRPSSSVSTAVKENRFSSVRVLLENGRSPDVATDGEDSPLYVAARDNMAHMVQLLLSNDASIGFEEGRYGSALCVAAARKHEEMVALLLEKGANIDFSSGRYGSALGFAAARNHGEMVALFLERGATVDGTGDTAATPLAYAIAAGHARIQELLQRQGATAIDSLHGGDAILEQLSIGGSCSSFSTESRRSIYTSDTDSPPEDRGSPQTVLHEKSVPLDGMEWTSSDLLS